MVDFLQTLVSGFAVGSFYALIALGYTMVYGVLKFINFAHGDVFVVGVWVSYLLSVACGWAEPDVVPPAWAAPIVLLLAMVACGALGFVIERFAYRPLRSAPRLNVLITAIGVSLLLQNVGQLPYVFGTQPVKMPSLIGGTDSGYWNVGGVHIGVVELIGAGTALLLMFGLERLIFHSSVGRAMRAVSFSPANAALMGIPVDRIISLTFVIGSSLAAAAGFLYALNYPGINQPAFPTWVLLGLKAFVAAVVGGIGNVRGAMLGGFCIGLLEQFGAKYLSTDLKDVYVFSLLILVLLVRPSGILGKHTTEKV